MLRSSRFHIDSQRVTDMAVGGLLALLDDVGAMTAKVAKLTGVAAKSGAAVLTDDFAVNAGAIQGVDPKRELPMLHEIFKGAIKNKPILVGGAVGLNMVAPWALGPLLMCGGAFLAYEGAHKIHHAFVHHRDHPGEDEEPVVLTSEEREREMISSAVTTDWILSAEVIAIGLNTMKTEHPAYQVASLLAVGAAMSYGVYKIGVAGLVRADDVGMRWAGNTEPGRLNDIRRAVGPAIVKGMPYVMTGISVIGTGAMLWVGGALVAHSIPFVETAIHGASQFVTGALSAFPSLAGAAGTLTSVAGAGVFGLGVGAAIAAAVPKVSPYVAKAIAPVRTAFGSLAEQLRGLKNRISGAPAPARESVPAVNTPAAAKEPAAEAVAAGGISAAIDLRSDAFAPAASGESAAQMPETGEGQQTKKPGPEPGARP